ISYAAGDKLISQLAAILMESIRPDDFAGRWRFGDEFVVILPHTPLLEAAGIADRVRTAIEETSRGWTFPVTVSVGVVEYPVHGHTVDELVGNAEQALKNAKTAGKNKTVVAG
ncbi:MAG: GGDEF domain-containing protein, partial [Anaerolineales bacterium]